MMLLFFFLIHRFMSFAFYGGFSSPAIFAFGNNLDLSRSFLYINRN